MKYIIIMLWMTLALFGNNEGTLMIEVTYDKENYKITRAWKLEQTFPATASSPFDSNHDVLIEIKDENKKVVEVLRISNPNILRGVFEEGYSETGHVHLTKDNGMFIIRILTKKG